MKRLISFVVRLAFGWMLAFGLAGNGHAADKVIHVTYYYTDSQGSVLATADESGRVLTVSDRKPYGDRAMGLPEEGPGYAGHVDDPDTGLVYMQARYYDPSVGRFLSVDPDAAGDGDVHGISRFAYGNDNPVAYRDPDGRQSVPLDAYTSRWPGSEQEKLYNFISGMGGTFVSILTMSNVFDKAPAGSGSGAVASSGFPLEFAAAGGATMAARAATSVLRASVEAAGEGVAASAATAATVAPTLPRMRLLDITARGAKMPNYQASWTLRQFEDHLDGAGFTSQVNGPVKLWFDPAGTKTFSTRTFSTSTNGATGELYRAGQKGAAAKVRFLDKQTP